MNAFLGFILKEFRHILRDRRTLAILFGLPIVQLLLFGYAIRNELTSAEIAVWDQARTAESRAAIARLEAGGYFRVMGRVDSETQVDHLFRRGVVRQVVVFPTDGPRVHLITDGSDPNMARLLQRYTMGVLSDVEPGKDVRTTYLYNPGLKSANLFVPGLMAVILMLVSTLMTSISLTREKETGTLETLLASPLAPAQIIWGKVLPYLLVSFVNVGTVLVIARAVFGVPFNGSVALFIFVSLLYAFTALALGMLISTVARTQQTAMMLSLGGLLLPTILLSGFIYPISNMPDILQAISHVIPARWYMVANRAILLKGAGLADIGREVLILAGMTALFLTVSIRRFPIRLD